MSKEITISVPDGKRAEWINGVLTLTPVDEPKVDNRPVTERIRTFEDAREALGEEHPLVKEYWGVVSLDLDITQDLIAYLKLRIIVASLNEGWEPKFTKDENRYLPWFKLYTRGQFENLDDEEKGRVVYRGNSYAYAFRGVSLANATTISGFRLTFRTKDLAAYAGRQFAKEWADFMFKPLTVDEVKQL